MTKQEYFEEMRHCGFDDDDTELFWRSENRMRVLAEAIADGERDLCASTEDYL